VGVVDPGDDVLDPVGLTDHAGREDVRVVAVRDGRKSVGVVDPRLVEGVAVEPETCHLLPAEVGAQPTERVSVLVDDRDGVTVVLERLGQSGADAPTSHDDEVHKPERYSRFTPVGTCDGPATAVRRASSPPL